jgi:hypothetical protein
MNRSKQLYRRRHSRLFLLLSLTLAALGFAPGLPLALAPAQAAPAGGNASEQQNPAAAPSPEQQNPEEASPEKKISPQEAAQLFRDIDAILKFASRDTDLPIKQEVKRRLATREEVVAYLEKSMAEDKDTERLRRSERVLKKFGLLPADFDLEGFLVKLLREQVAGYYDAKTKTVNLLDWIGPEQQRPVMAHELTHALQDQSFGLEKWMKRGDIDLDRKKNPTPEDIERDEDSEARQAVVEGQAMVVLVDFMLDPTGQSLLSSPQIAKALTEGMLVGTSDSPEFQKAPIFLKESLTFPYRYGLDFEAELLRSGGKQKAFAGAFTHPPQTTREIMEPKAYLSGERLDAVPLPDFKRDFDRYERFDIGAMGEFDVAILLDQYASPEVSPTLYPHWRGGYYYAVQPKDDRSAPLGLLYWSRWSDGESAARFAAIYAKGLALRYKQVHEAAEAPPMPPAGVTEQPPGSISDLSTPESLTGRHTWQTNEGPVVIRVQQETVLVTESLDPATTARLEQELLGSSTTKP